MSDHVVVMHPRPDLFLCHPGEHGSAIILVVDTLLRREHLEVASVVELAQTPNVRFVEEGCPRQNFLATPRKLAICREGSRWIENFSTTHPRHLPQTLVPV